MTAFTASPKLPKHQHGASLVLAIFIIVVLSLLAAAMLRTISAGSENVAREVVSTRAFLTAESGAEARLNDLFMGGVACTDACSAPGVKNYGGNANWLNCSAQVSCCRYNPGTGENYYQLESVGRCGPAGDRAVRVVEVRARD